MAIHDEVIERIEALSDAQTSLRNNLAAKGVVLDNSVHIPSLAEYVEELECHAYANEGTITLVQRSDTLIISNLPQKPVEVGLISHTLREATDIVSNVSGYCVCDIKAAWSNASDTTITVGDCVVTRTQIGNNWQVSFSYEAHNTSNPSSVTYFWGGEVYTWLALYHELLGSIKYYKKIEAGQLTALQTGTTGLSLANAQRISKIEFDLMRAAIALKTVMNKYLKLQCPLTS